VADIHFFFDDSGVLHRNEHSGYFVYAGYAFVGRAELDDAKHKYIHANKLLKQTLKTESELKAAMLSNSHRRALYNILRNYRSISCCVKIDKLYDYILNEKKAICRYKDYLLKRCVKAELQSLIDEHIIDTNDDTRLYINIDEQLTATNGYYSLRDSIKEELLHGVRNFDYGTVHSKLSNGKLEVNIKYCESAYNYMIQASDIIANKILTLCRKGQTSEISKISRHIHLTFPQNSIR